MIQIVWIYVLGTTWDMFGLSTFVWFETLTVLDDRGNLQAQTTKALPNQKASTYG